jgi:hypothetical protein
MADYSLNKGRKIDEDYKRKAREPLLPESFWTGRRKQLMDASKAGVSPEESIISKAINYKGARNEKPTSKSEDKPSVKSEAKPSIKMSASPSVSKGMPLSDEIDSLVGSSKSSNTAPDAVIKKTEIVKTAPVVSRKSTPSAPVRKSMSEGQRIRDAIESMRGQYESGDLYNKTGLEKSAQDANTAEDMNTEGKLDAVEPVTINAKKGGMTKRPPKPAKKVPPRKFASGGSVSRTSASKRGDGCATKGHTKGKYC